MTSKANENINYQSLGRSRNNNGINVCDVLWGILNENFPNVDNRILADLCRKLGSYYFKCFTSEPGEALILESRLNEDVRKNIKRIAALLTTKPLENQLTKNDNRYESYKHYLGASVIDCLSEKIQRKQPNIKNETIDLILATILQIDDDLTSAQASPYPKIDNNLPTKLKQCNTPSSSNEFSVYTAKQIQKYISSRKQRAKLIDEMLMRLGHQNSCYKVLERVKL